MSHRTLSVPVGRSVGVDIETVSDSRSSSSSRKIVSHDGYDVTNEQRDKLNELWFSCEKIRSRREIVNEGRGSREGFGG